jgi:hypothetical protein
MVLSCTPWPDSWGGRARTNLDTALRLQIPRGSGIFLVDRNAGDSSRKLVGVIIDPLQPKK